MSSNLENEKLRSRFGYHPCDYELYLKLKFLHKHYWIAVRQFHHWHRWFRKEPQNRIGPEPKYCSAFVENRTWAKPVKAGFKIYPRMILDHRLIETFKLARMPVQEPVEEFESDLVKRIETLYTKVKEDCPS